MRTRYLIALLLLIPLVDSFVLVAIVGYGLLTWLQTIALVVLTGLLGMLLVRAEGRATIRRTQKKLAAGDIPTNELLDGGLLIAAGAFLLTPGLVTDLIGFLLTLPPTRYPIRELLKRLVVKPYLDKRSGGFVSGNVYTFGFPNQGQGQAQGSPFGSEADTGFGASNRDVTEDNNRQDRAANDVVDVDFDTVETDEDRSSGSNSSR
ncbi:FxsA family protein [Natronocalculus amylovorans]|uniref:Membrane protein FxsA n=1 Tax=Natronocalculus amylovorans TaxID=2917812 RepID=A0AAE3FW33_9EURY|nr:FxsA family protein [Natronocalculus amylovorans]MCL9816667.1 membrane protein FxsA [Natronocalculus amylovorans]